MGATLRLAGPADVPAIHALVESAYRGETARGGWTHEADLLTGDRTSAAEIGAIIAAADQRLIVAEVDDQILGSVTITAKPPRAAYLGMLAVAPDQQAGGLGRSLIAAAETEANRVFAADRMEMTVISKRAELIAWYERRGYCRTGELRPFPYEAPETEGLEMAVLERQIA